MTTLTVGRMTGASALTNLAQMDSDGEIVSLSGITSVDPTEALYQLDQILGLMNEDEPVVPLTYTGTSRVDGFYRVISTSVSPGRLPNGAFRWSMSLQRVPGFTSPLFQSTLVGTVRANGLGIISGDAWHSVPLAASEYGPLDQTDASAIVTRSADGVDMLFRALPGGPNRTIQYYLTPSSYYNGAAMLEVGTTLRTVVGRQVQNSPVDWRLSNGLVRVTPGASGRINVSHYDGTQWDTTKTFTITVEGLLIASFTNLTVLRNSPEETIIRLSAQATGTVQPPMRLDIALRRGSRIVNCTTTAVLGGTQTAVIARFVAEASTALTGGLRATSNDASGNRFILLSGRKTATDLVNGSITVTSLSATKPVHPFCIASEVGGTGAAAHDTAANIQDQYFMAQAERVMVVAR